ncbi:MAG: [LysW]-lysine hydrolase [Anaerolineae bacterium]|nr:[LysW]-lysine hydrolase [Anaerolineae bacterium]MDW8172737.1 [LysW]-lysine hydrolase [Anaerolineae bacterium]
MPSVSDDQAERLVEMLVSIPSPTYQELPASTALVGWMNAHGYRRAFVDEVGNAVGIRGNLSSSARQVILLGHIDTFGGFPPVRREGRLLYGRGSVDAKGPLCSFTVAGARASLPSDVQLIVVGAVEEECPTSKGARHIAAHHNPCLVVIGEPSHWERMTLGYKGRLVLEWRYQGGMSHSAGQIDFPAEVAFAAWQAVSAYAARYNEGRERVFEQLGVTLTAINSGQDGAYGWAQMSIGLRLPPNMNPHALEAELRPLLEVEGSTLRAYGHEVAVQADKDSALTRLFRAAIRAEGGNPSFVYKTGTSDMNAVAPSWECPMIAYGAGDSRLDHTPHEHLNLDEYLRAIRVLTHVLERA